MYIDWNNITYNELNIIGEFFSFFIDGDRKQVIITGVKK